MATLGDRLSALFRFRVGKFDSTTLPDDLGIYGRTISGSFVNESSALGISTVYACVNKIASTVASLGLEVMVEDRDSVVMAMLSVVIIAWLVWRKANRAAIAAAIAIIAGSAQHHQLQYQHHHYHYLHHHHLENQHHSGLRRTTPTQERWRAAS